MNIFYIISGMFLLILAVFFLFKRNEMKRQKKNIIQQKEQIQLLNQQLDDIDDQ